jgi:hypothetical protein
MILLLFAAVFSLGMVVGAVYEGCRRGGTLDLQLQVAALRLDDRDEATP